MYGNTLFRNGGSGVELVQPPGYCAVEKNIGFENEEWGLKVEASGVGQVACNDWFGNGLGSVSGVAVGASDLSVDPLFCNADSADVGLLSASPLVNASGCGQIGALGVGCGITATVIQRFTAERVTAGIQVVWQVAESATASEVWVERSEAMEGGAWARPLTERSIDNQVVVELDRSAASDRAYRYRLMALEGNEVTVIGPPIIVEGQARLDSRLVEMGPNPGGGPVRIAFALQHSGTIEVDVFDIQGRSVASLARGTWPAGTHELEWNGRTRGWNPAPAGVYVVRYVYPGGQDKRAIVRVR
jgi:hypothetical protein